MERKKRCGLLWKAVNEQTRQKFKDPEYLATLPNPFGRDEETGTPPTTQKKKNAAQRFRDVETERWSSRVILDVSYMCLL